MNKPVSETINIDVESKLLATLRELANGDGAELASLIDEALADLIAKRRTAAPRSRVMSAYLKSHDNFEGLYQKLAK